jgi:hypothetical protein
VSTQKHDTRGSKLAAVERSPDALGGLHVHVARRFRRPEVRERARRYLAGLLGRVVFPLPTNYQYMEAPSTSTMQEMRFTVGIISSHTV